MTGVAIATGTGKSIEQALAKRTVVVLLVVSLCAAILLTVFSVRRFEQILLPQLLAKSTVIGISVRNNIEGALKLGIPFESLVGVHEFLSEILIENPEIAFIQVKGAGHPDYLQVRTGVTNIASADIVTQQVAATDSAPAVAIGVRATYLQEKLNVMFGDAVVVSLVALITGLEIALFFAFRWLLRPLDTWRAMIAGLASGDIDRDLKNPGAGPFTELLQLSNKKIAALRASRVEGGGGGGSVSAALKEWYRPLARDVRIGLFLYVLSEELLRSFFPLYVKEMVDTTSRFGVEFAISAPIMAYMFFAGAGTLFGGNVVERIGLRRAFALSVALGIVSLCGLAAATTLTELIAWRSVSAIGYAVATITCQVYIARTMEPGGSTRGLATFVSAVTAAGICGAPIGAVLADIFGQPVTLLCAAAVALLSWLVFRGVALPANPVVLLKTDSSRAVEGGFRDLLTNRRVQLLMGCAVVPGKMLLAGMLFYITPLLLQKYLLSQASIGQFFVLYYVLLLAGNTLGSTMIGNIHAQVRVVVTGALISGTGALAMFWLDSPLALAGAIVCFGCCQSMMLTPINAILLRVVKDELPQVTAPKAIALSRIFDRIGGISGAALAALLSGWFGYQGAVSALGAIVIIFGLGTIPLLRVYPAIGARA